MMKRIIQLIALIVLLPAIGMTQSQSINKLFNKYGKLKGFDFESGKSEMNFDIENDNDFAGFLNSMEVFSILSFEKENGDRANLAALKTKLDKIIGKYDFRSMLDIQSDGGFRLLSRKDKNGKTTDYLMIIEGNEDASFILASANRKTR